MRTVVPVKRVVDYNVKVRVKSDGTGVDIANVKMSRCSARVDGKCNAVPPPLRALPSGAHILCHRSADELQNIQPVRGAA